MHHGESASPCGADVRTRTGLALTAPCHPRIRSCPCHNLRTPPAQFAGKPCHDMVSMAVSGRMWSKALARSRLATKASCIRAFKASCPFLQPACASSSDVSAQACASGLASLAPTRTRQKTDSMLMGRSLGRNSPVVSPGSPRFGEVDLSYLAPGTGEAAETFPEVQCFGEILPHRFGALLSNGLPNAFKGNRAPNFRGLSRLSKFLQVLLGRSFFSLSGPRPYLLPIAFQIFQSLSQILTSGLGAEPPKNFSVRSAKSATPVAQPEPKLIVLHFRNLGFDLVRLHPGRYSAHRWILAHRLAGTCCPRHCSLWTSKSLPHSLLAALRRLSVPSSYACLRIGFAWRVSTLVPLARLGFPRHLIGMPEMFVQAGPNNIGLRFTWLSGVCFSLYVRPPIHPLRSLRRPFFFDELFYHSPRSSGSLGR